MADGYRQVAAQEPRKNTLVRGHGHSVRGSEILSDHGAGNLIGFVTFSYEERLLCSRCLDGGVAWEARQTHRKPR